MRLMLCVSDKLALTRENQLTKAAIETELIATSKLPGMPVLSKTLTKYAATLMREPESQSGASARSKRKRAAE